VTTFCLPRVLIITDNNNNALNNHKRKSKINCKTFHLKRRQIALNYHRSIQAIAVIESQRLIQLAVGFPLLVSAEAVYQTE
jgi:hypothetical protein